MAGTLNWLLNSEYSLPLDHDNSLVVVIIAITVSKLAPNITALTLLLLQLLSGVRGRTLLQPILKEEEKGLEREKWKEEGKFIYFLEPNLCIQTFWVYYEHINVIITSCNSHQNRCIYDIFDFCPNLQGWHTSSHRVFLFIHQLPTAGPYHS